MRKIVLMMSVSLDGYFEGPDRELDWHLISDELHSHFNEELGAMSAFLDGRVSYELMAQYWPTADQDPSNPAPVAEFARIWRDMPKIVYSTTMQRADWNTTVVHDVVPEDVRALKEQSGGDLALGGANLAATFMRYDLVDEIRLYVHPVLLGRGRPLFPQGTRTVPLELDGTRTFANGVVMLRYGRPGGHAVRDTATTGPEPA